MKFTICFNYKIPGTQYEPINEIIHRNYITLYDSRDPV